MNTIYSMISVIKSTPSNFGSDTRLDKEFTHEIDKEVILSLSEGKTLCLRNDDQSVTCYKVVSCQYHPWDESALLIVKEQSCHDDLLSKLTEDLDLE